VIAWQHYLDAKAAFFAIARLDGAVMQANASFGNSQANPSSSGMGTPGVTYSEKRLKNIFDHLFRNTRTTVFDQDANTMGFRHNTYFNSGPFRRVPHGISHNVLYSTLNQSAV
jgi:hypothetical protein